MAENRRVVVVGCGVVGAAIAYELSQTPGYAITIIDQHAPAQASTGAALGVLMGAISQKVKGKNWRMRLESLHWYDRWIPHLEAVTGRRIPFNRNGILRLCFADEDLARWERLVQKRQEQGFQLVMCDRPTLAAQYPHLSLDTVIGAVYSPRDRQVDPTALTLALIAAAQQQGATVQFQCPMQQAAVEAIAPEERACRAVITPTDALPTDWLILAAGLGSTPLTTSLHQPVDLRPVLGQALRLRLPAPLGIPEQEPVITGNDVHIVPLGEGEYWVGATVEFDGATPIADPALLEAVLHQAIALCPGLSDGKIVQQWSGLRPRPEGRPAPIIERLPGYRNVIVASGHYRNGVLLAPATALRVRALLESDAPGHYNVAGSRAIG